MSQQLLEIEYTHAHLFGGVGGGAMGFNRATARLGRLAGRLRCLGSIDVDAAACRAFERNVGAPARAMDLFDYEQYVAWHGREPPPGWREAMPQDVHAAFQHTRPDLGFLSAPCLPADGLVLTADGPRAIGTLTVGDRVLTHRGRLRDITDIGCQRYVGTMYGVRLNGTVDYQWFTDEHPLLVRRVTRPAASRQRHLTAPEFVAAGRLRVGDRIGFPVDTEICGTAAAFIAALGDPRLAKRGGRSAGRYAKPEHIASLGRVMDFRGRADDPDLWFLLGCYLGDGYRRKSGGYVTNFCVGAQQGELASQVRGALARLGVNWTEDLDGGPTNIRIRAASKHLHVICGTLGDGAEHKRIPSSLMSLETSLVVQLLAGYRATDGSIGARRRMPRGNTLQARWKIPSVSLQLLRDVQRLLLRTGVYASIHKCWPGGPQTIEGRAVQTKPRWELNARLDPRKRTVFEFIDGVVWVRVRTVARRQTDERVWNISVDEDDTFCAPMMATHNCKGFSGLLPESTSRLPKYEALNRLTLRGVWLWLEAFQDDPTPLIFFENVPRILARGRGLLDQIAGLFQAYGYAWAETTHDCGELGGLGQTRRRFLGVARHMAKVPPFLYQPPKRALRGVGEILERLPLPGDVEAGGPMHRLPALQWQTWVRLAFVDAGKDWRSLNALAVEDGYLRDLALEPDTRWQAGVMGVRPWSQPAGVISTRGAPTNGAYTVADPRVDGHPRSVQLGVRPWARPSAVVKGDVAIGTGPYAVSDPGLGERTPFSNVFRIVARDETAQAITSARGAMAAVADPRGAHDRHVSGKYRVTPYGGPANAVIGASTTGNGAAAIADVRTGFGPNSHRNKLRVVGYAERAPTVTGSDRVGSGALSVADIRPPGLNRQDRAGYATQRHYGVVGWRASSACVTGSAKSDNGAWSVADARAHVLPPALTDRLVCVIIARDGTWHRPFTTLDLAALQSLVDPDNPQSFRLEGTSDSAHREWIGNAVPPGAAQAMGEVALHTLLMAEQGESFRLSDTPIWVRQLAVALSVDTGPQVAS